MAQRLSNEIIAQVLTDVVTKLDKSINSFRGEMSDIKQDLTAHREATQKVLSKAISVDVKPIQEERAKLLQEVQKEKEDLKKTFKNMSFVKYVVYIAIGTILVNAFILGYFIYSATKVDTDKMDELQREVNVYRFYQDENPKAKEEFKTWYNQKKQQQQQNTQGGK